MKSRKFSDDYNARTYVTIVEVAKINFQAIT